MSEWKDCSSLKLLAEAQDREDKIEYRNMHDEWVFWNELIWRMDYKYRCRPKQPKMKRVEMLAWFNGYRLDWVRKGDVLHSSVSIRVPAEDKIIEVPE